MVDVTDVHGIMWLICMHEQKQMLSIYNQDCQLVQCAYADESSTALCCHGIDHTPHCRSSFQEQLLELTM